MGMTEMTEIKSISDAAVRMGCKAFYDVSLRDYTTIKIGGKVPLLITIASVDALNCLLKLIKVYNAPFTVIGNGSNIIADDRGVNRVILRMDSDFSAVTGSADYLQCQAGALLSSVCRVAQKNSLSGAEPLFGIPGTIGGAVFMNAGAYGREIADLVESVTVLTSDGTEQTFTQSECQFAYRSSVFMSNQTVITGVKLKLTRGNSEEIKAQMDSFTKRRREKQPLELPSAGSAFKRPKVGYASELIDRCGLKGLTVGGAQVSTKHAGFIVNTGGAAFSDVMALMREIIETVEKKTAFRLEPEPVILSDMTDMSEFGAAPDLRGNGEGKLSS